MFDGSYTKQPLAVPASEIDELVRRAQAERARVVGEMIADGIAKVILAVRRWDETRTAVRELSSLDDRMLQDIGVTRGEIKDVVAQAQRLSAQARGEHAYGLFHAIAETFRRWRLRARTRAELSALDDAMLRDIGIERGQIEGIAEAVANGEAIERNVYTPTFGNAGIAVPAAANTNVRRAYPAAAQVDAAD